jgi:hypothetical protein
MQKSKTKQDTRPKPQNPRRITIVCGLWSLVCGLLLPGCAEQQQYQVAEPLLMENTDKLRVMEAAEDVLVKMYFTIEKANAEDGFIRTRPLQGAQFFELWRSDNVGAGNWLLNNLHSIRRIAELNISEQDKDLNINCEVKTYRLSLPEREIRSAHAYDLFSASSPYLQRIQLHPKQKEHMAWIDLGKDEQLAAEILKRIEQQIVSRQTASDKI